MGCSSPLLAFQARTVYQAHVAQGSNVVTVDAFTTSVTTLPNPTSHPLPPSTPLLLLLPPPSFPPEERCGGRAVGASPPPWVQAWLSRAENETDAETDNNYKDGRPPWCLDVPAQPQNSSVYLASIVYVRIWPKEDLARLTFTDLAHWLTYSRYVGVERVYLYDTHHDDEESVLNDEWIKTGVDSGFIELIDWQSIELGNLKADGTRKQKHESAVQGTAYQHVQKNYGNMARWMTFTDMDEYPFCKGDTAPGFLSRFLLNAEREEDTQGNLGACERTTQFKMPNILLEGGRDDPRANSNYTRTGSKAMLIQQATRLGKAPANNLVKQIVRLDAAKKHGVHGSNLAFGRTTALKAGDGVYMKHAWGGRRFGWRRIDEMNGEERGKLFAETVENDNAGIDRQVLRCFPSM